MDLSQTKLTRAEWETIEVPIPDNEKKILSMINAGYLDVNIRTNESQSLYSFTKIEQTPEAEFFLYKKYFEDVIKTTLQKYGKNTKITPPQNSSSGGDLKTLKSADMIRIQNLDANVSLNRPSIFEYLLLDLTKDLLKNFYKDNDNYAFYLYTLIHLKKASIRSQNKYVLEYVNAVIEYTNKQTEPSEIITNAYRFIERNDYLLKYEDRVLFPHQKQLFTLCRKPTEEVAEMIPKLILYTAPTGTGKTLSPIGLSQQYRIIFVCVARHIGLALAKSAISMEKKIAIAFGCETASDIRLHYFSALNYTKNKRSGGIGKVDNSVGDNVEIMICDVESYLVAMYYMMSFNDKENIITYWDEPTITMDYDDHELHKTIHRNWKENQIPTMILSCATLPSETEIQPVFEDFRDKFDMAEIHTITSFDCRKSIPILNKNGYCVLPHYLYSDYGEMIKCALYCQEHKTLLRYFDLREIIKFVDFIDTQEMIDDNYAIDSYFSGGIIDITMNSMKEYYLEVLLHLQPENWDKIFKYMNYTKKQKYCQAKSTLHKTTSVDNVNKTESTKLTRTVSVAPDRNVEVSASSSTGISLTTSDSYTLTDGPTIFLAEDVSKIGKFYVQQSNIPSNIFSGILSKIMKNNEIISQIDKLESEITQKDTKTTVDKEGKDKVIKTDKMSDESRGWMEQINKLRKEIQMVSLDPMYLPNSRQHQHIWAPNGEVHENAFVSHIGEEMAKTIMLLDIDNNLKVLLLLGIGMLIDKSNVRYMEIMKQLANEQRLFIIIASTDYIYGTNYQFCHGFIGKDLTNMTQQKTLQAMGRIGRNNIQQDYTIRFRDDEMIMRLFEKPAVNKEAENMCKILSR